MEKKEYIKNLKAWVKIGEDNIINVQKNNSANHSLFESSNDINLMTINVIEATLKVLNRVRAPFSWGLNKPWINSLLSQVRTIKGLQDKHASNYIQHLDKSFKNSLTAHQQTLELLNYQLADLESTEEKHKTMHFWDLIEELEKSIDKVSDPELKAELVEEKDKRIKENFEYIKSFQRNDKEM